MVAVAVTPAERTRMQRYRRVYSLARVLDCFFVGKPLPVVELGILQEWGMDVCVYDRELWLETRTADAKTVVVAEVTPLLARWEDNALRVHMHDHGPDVVWLTVGLPVYGQ